VESEGGHLRRMIRSVRFLVAVGVIGLLAAPDVRAHDDPDATLQRLDAEIAASPKDADLWQSRAVYLRRAGAFARADESLDRAVEFGLAVPIAHRDRGLIRLAERRFAEAEEMLRSARQLAPHEPPILLGHARALAALERFDEAAQTYAELVEAAPLTGPDVRLEQIRAIAARGETSALDEAIRAADAAIAAIGSVPALEQAALDLELRADRVDAALARLDRMASGMGRRDAVLLQRAAVLEKAGRKEAAKTAYADALAATETLTDARRATPAAREMENQARDAIARLARGDPE